MHLENPMTVDEELSHDARALLRRAKGYADPSRYEVTTALHRFADELGKRPARRNPLPQKPIAWALAALTLSASVGALAKWGEIWTERSEPAPPPVVQPTVSSVAPEVRSRQGRLQRIEVVPASSGDSPSPIPTASFAAPPVARERPELVGRVQPGVDRTEPLTQRAEPLAAELQLIARARDALRTGDHALASRLASEHARRHATGVLVQERMAIAALSECRAGTGETLGAAFVQRWSESPFAGTVARDCSLNPIPEPPSAIGVPAR
jgi:hypothetical protein